MAAVAASERQGAVLEIRKRRHRAPGDRDDLGHPTHIRIAHRDRSAAVVAPGIGLDISEVRIPSDVDVLLVADTISSMRLGSSIGSIAAYRRPHIFLLHSDAKP